MAASRRAPRVDPTDPLDARLLTLPGLRERCLRVGSAGKTFSLTGWKVGYITAPRPLAFTAYIRRSAAAMTA